MVTSLQLCHMTTVKRDMTLYLEGINMEVEEIWLSLFRKECAQQQVLDNLLAYPTKNSMVSLAHI